MNKLVLSLACFAVSCTMSAHAGGLACADLKDKITAKLERKGVKHYSLETVDKDHPTKLRVVGTCDKGGQKIVYHGSRKAKIDAEPELLGKVVENKSP